MKNILKSALLIFVLCGLASCTEKIQNTVEYIEVTANNLAGDWKLETMNGVSAEDAGVSVYLRFVRKDSRYEMYSNEGSMEFVRRSGKFVILEDEILGYILRGDYDYTLGEQWNHDYLVSLSADRMVWTAYDDPADVCVYVREAIPDGIVSAFPPLDE